MLGYRGLFLWLTPGAYVSNVFALPLVNIMLFAFAGCFTHTTVDGAMVIGLAMAGTSGIVLSGVAQSIYYDRLFGTLVVGWVYAAHPLRAFWTKTVAHLVNGVLTFGSVLAACAFTGIVDFADASVPGMIAALAVMLASSWAFAQFVGVVSLLAPDWLSGVALGNSLLLTLTGIVIPRDELPALLNVLGRVLPLTEGLAGLRADLMGADLHAMATGLFVELTVAVAYAAAASVVFVTLRRSYRVHGGLPGRGAL